MEVWVDAGVGVGAGVDVEAVLALGVGFIDGLTVGSEMRVGAGVANSIVVNVGMLEITGVLKEPKIDERNIKIAEIKSLIMDYEDNYIPQKIRLCGGFLDRVAGLGVAPSLKDYEPFVQLYTTPHVLNEHPHYIK